MQVFRTYWETRSRTWNLWLLGFWIKREDVVLSSVISTRGAVSPFLLGALKMNQAWNVPRKPFSPRHDGAEKNNKTWKKKPQILLGWMPKYSVVGAKRAARFGSQIFQPFFDFRMCFDPVDTVSWQALPRVSKYPLELTYFLDMAGTSAALVSHLVSHLTLHWVLGLEGEDNHSTQYRVTHHPFTVGFGKCTGGRLGCEWVTDQAHSRKEMFQRIFFKSAAKCPWEPEYLE